MEHIANVLTHLGLNDKEAHLYLELLQIGSQPASVVARKVNLPRSSAQFVAESLVKKGFATKYSAKKITYYQVIEPSHLPRILAAQKNQFLHELETKKNVLQNAIPDMLQLQKHELKRPQVSFFEGDEGIRLIYEDSLFCQNPEGIRSLVNFEDRSKHLPDYFNEYYKRRKQAGIKMRAIYQDTEFGRERHSRDTEDLRQSKLIDANKYHWLPEIQFYDNKVTIASGSEKIGVIIESKEIAEAMKVMFDLAWESKECKE